MAILRKALIAFLLCVPCVSFAGGGWDKLTYGGSSSSTYVAEGTGYSTMSSGLLSDCEPAGPNYGSCSVVNDGSSTCGFISPSQDACSQVNLHSTQWNNVYQKPINYGVGSYVQTISCAAGYVFNGSYTSPACILNTCPAGQVLVNGTCQSTCASLMTAGPGGSPQTELGAPLGSTGNVLVPLGGGISYHGNNSYSAVACDNSTNCQYEASGQSQVTAGSLGPLLQYTADGNACGTSDPNLSSVGAPNATTETAPNGTTIGSTPIPNQPDTPAVGGSCGQVNGQNVCVNPVANNTCTSTPSGMGVCTFPAGLGLSSPPTPDDGSPGVPAPPAAQLCDPTTYTCTYVYTTNQETTSTYKGSSSGGSSSSSSGGHSSSSSSGGSGSSGGSSSGSGSSGGSGGCSSSGSTGGSSSGGCSSGSPFTGAGPGSVASFSDSLSSFESTISASPIAGAVAGVSAAVPTGGSLPSATFNIFNQTFTLAIPSSLISLLPVLSGLMLCMWALVAIFIFLKA